MNVYNHEPPDYECPLCDVVAGRENPPWVYRSDVIYQDDHTTAWLNARWWGDIEGNAVVVPNAHHENIFDLPDEAAAQVHNTARKIATAMMETYGCPGISTRQHNGPDGNQEVWHYHLHVFPRYDRTDLYGATAHMSSIEERAPYAERLRSWFAAN